jgi:hypothetical protein
MRPCWGGNHMAEERRSKTSGELAKAHGFADEAGAFAHARGSGLDRPGPVRRWYGWARGQGWARRPTRRCLRIGEASFAAGWR